VEAVKDSLIAGKDKVVAIVEEKMEAAKKVIHDHTAPAKKSVKKKAEVVKKAASKQIKKTVKKVEKKLPAKKSRKK
jgi:Icc-related predicted phosphoesterase